MDFLEVEVSLSAVVFYVACVRIPYRAAPTCAHKFAACSTSYIRSPWPGLTPISDIFPVKSGAEWGGRGSIFVGLGWVEGRPPIRGFATGNLETRSCISHSAGQHCRSLFCGARETRNSVPVERITCLHNSIVSVSFISRTRENSSRTALVSGCAFSRKVQTQRAQFGSIYFTQNNPQRLLLQLSACTMGEDTFSFVTVSKGSSPWCLCSCNLSCVTAAENVNRWTCRDAGVPGQWNLN